MIPVPPHSTSRAEDAIVGCLLGTALGDSIGLPYEGLSRRRAARLLGSPIQHRLVLGRGMVSDDTEHTCMVAQALIASRGDDQHFARHFAWGLRLWLLGLPAGVGFATLRACLRLWMGISPQRSGVFSAGNGPAMRSAIIGAAITDREAMLRLVGIATRITHTDPKAQYAAAAVALAAHLARDGTAVTPDRYLDSLSTALPHAEAGELLALLEKAAASVQNGQSTPGFADTLGLTKGVSGYAYHSVPIAIHAWLAHPAAFRTAVETAIACGGDTDTVAAITGGIVGSGVGAQGLPAEWLSTLTEWPRSVGWMRKLGARTHRVLALDEGLPTPHLFAPAIVARNVLVHGLRRLLPPY